MAAQTDRRRSARGALAYLGVAAIQRGSFFLVLPLFASTLGPANYGQIATLLSVFGLTTMLLPAGLDTPLFRAMFSRDTAESHERYVSTLVTALFAGPIVLGGIIGLIASQAPPLFGMRPMHLGMYIAMAGIFSAATVAPLAILKAKESFAFYAFLSLSYAAVQLALRVTFVVVSEMGVAGWVLADMSATVFALCLSLIWQGRYISIFRAKRSDLRSALSTGLPLVPHAAAHWGLNLSDRLILAAFWSPAVVGVYSVGYQIAFVAGIAVTELNRAFMPRYGEAARTNGAGEVLGIYARYQILISVALTAQASLFGPQVVHLLLPDSYSGAARLIPFVALGFAFLGVYYVPINLVAIVAGQTRGVWTSTLCAASINVGANLLLVPHFGPIAAALNTALGYLALLLVVVAMARRRCPSITLNLRPIAFAVPAAVAVTALGSFIAVRPGPAGLSAAAICGCLVLVILAVPVAAEMRRGKSPQSSPAGLYA